MAVKTPVLRSQLGLFLAGGHRLVFPPVVSPELTVVVLVAGRPDLFLACLRSLRAEATAHVEVVLVSHKPQEIMRRVLQRVANVTQIRTEQPVSRTDAERLAVDSSSGEFLVWLDPDCLLQPGSLAAGLSTIRSRPEIGAVGGKTVRRDETLEEAGSILWQDGSSESYGTGGDPLAPEVMFTREVDFCAGGCLLTRRQSFLAGTTPTTDAGSVLDRILLGARLRAAGLVTIYDPTVVVVRAGQLSEAAQIQTGWQTPEPAVVATRLGEHLRGQLPRSGHNVLVARHRATGRYRVLHIEYRIPHSTLGAGYPRTRSIVEELVKLGYFVTFHPVDRLFRAEKWAEVHECLDRSVEVMINRSAEHVEQFLEDRAGYYDAILISRPPTMEAVQAFLPRNRPDGRPRLVFDAEALYAIRTIEQRRLDGEPLSQTAEQDLIATEIRLTDGSDAVLAVSTNDARSFAAYGVPNISILSHRIDPEPTPARFEQRSGFLFVGPVLSYGSPNSDSIEWFARSIFPSIRDQLGAESSFRVAGTNHAPQLFPLAGNGVEFLGRVADLTPAYNRARVFVAPTRFAAGIPFKCGEAAAQGVPIVMTSLLANQLGWLAEEEVLVADTAADFAAQCVRLYQDADLWARIRTGALRRVEETYSTRIFAATLRAAVGGPAPTPDQTIRPNNVPTEQKVV